MNALSNNVVALQARIISVRSFIAGGATPATHISSVTDYYLGSGDKCGPQTITGMGIGEQNTKSFQMNFNVFASNSRLDTECRLLYHWDCCGFWNKVH